MELIAGDIITVYQKQLTL